MDDECFKHGVAKAELQNKQTRFDVIIK